MSRTKQKFKLLANLLFFIASLELLYTGHLVYQNSQLKIQADTNINNIAERFSTELYFENPKALPKNIELYKEEKFRFTIHNREGKPIVYKYKAYIDTDGDKRILKQSEISVNNNESKTIEVNYRIFIPLGASRVFVKLFNNQQNINFSIK